MVRRLGLLLGSHALLSPAREEWKYLMSCSLQSSITPPRKNDSIAPAISSGRPPSPGVGYPRVQPLDDGAKSVIHRWVAPGGEEEKDLVKQITIHKSLVQHDGEDVFQQITGRIQMGGRLA